MVPSVRQEYGRGETVKKVALIIGVNGQDGSYMCEHLLGLGYVVHGTVRRASHPNLGRIKHLLDKVRLHYGDLTDAAGLVRLVRDLQPDEIYNLGAMSRSEERRVGKECRSRWSP